jgi:heat shock protein HslJ
MKRIGAVLLSLLLALPAWSQAQRAQFPFDREFVTASLNGESMAFSATLVVRKQGDIVRARGRLPCNAWSTRVDFNEDGKFAPFDESTTLVECGKEREDFEGRFMSAIVGAARWRVERNDLILEGNNMVLRFIPEGPSLRK